MTSELNCTQFTEPYPEPGTDKAANTAVPVFITAIVEAYRPFHTFLLLFLLIFAFVANILIVIVLWQKEMRKVGVNVTMMLIALCDFGCSVAALGQMLLRSYTESLWQSPSYAVRVALFLASPVFILSSVVLFVNTVQEDEEGVYIDISELSLRNNCMFLKTSLVMAGSCFKLFPCIGMLSLSIFLLGRIDDGKRSMLASISSNQKDKT
uniref:G-protein coupled receptors family 1 profile domain-containing protein n=1 Tax=Caenorhabditis japonica TaxID=281687 RepID=A0A8R1HXP8_CAEJA